MAKACAVDEISAEEKELQQALQESVKLRKEPHYDSMRSLHKRSMILDETNFEETFLRCIVCHESFDHPLRTPKLLPCHHSFCLQCIKHLFHTEVEFRQRVNPALRGMPHAVSIHCPTCRVNFVSTDENIKALPTDHRIVQLIDFVKHTERYSVTFCSKHKLQPLNFFCEPCVQPVCHDCTVLDHKEQDDHLVVNLNEALEKYTPVLDEALTEMEAEASVLDKKKESLEQATSKLEKNRSELLKNIHDTFERLKKQLADRQRELESIAENEVNKEKRKLDEKAEKLLERRKALIEHSATMRKAKEESNIEEMFSIHQKAREVRNVQPLKIREVDDGIMTSFRFNARDESLIGSRINNLGDISSHTESTAATNAYRSYPRSLSYR